AVRIVGKAPAVALAVELEPLPEPAQAILQEYVHASEHPLTHVIELDPVQRRTAQQFELNPELDQVGTVRDEPDIERLQPPRHLRFQLAPEAALSIGGQALPGLRPAWLGFGTDHQAQGMIGQWAAIRPDQLPMDVEYVRARGRAISRGHEQQC